MSPAPRIDAIYAWVCTEADGSEGIPACALPGSDGPLPLIGADQARIQSLRPWALAVAVEMGLPVKLVRFDRLTILETLPVVDRGRA
jgi:hypothetical protein